MQQKIILASANTGIGLWTTICVSFCKIFGTESKSYKSKQTKVLKRARERLNEQIKEYGDNCKITDLRVTWQASLACTISAVIEVPDEPKRQAEAHDILEEPGESPKSSSSSCHHSTPAAIKELSEDDISYKGNDLKIKFRDFNLLVQPVSSYSKEEKMVRFSFGQEEFSITFKSEALADDFYNFLENHK